MKRYTNLSLGLFLSMLILTLPVAAVDDSGKWHNPNEIDWNYNIEKKVKITGYESGPGGWRYTMKFTNPDHAMITFPAAKLGFGMHKNGNFYWSKLNQFHVMRLMANGDLNVRSNVYTKSLTIGGQLPCLEDGTNCPGYCKGKPEGKDFNIDIPCQYSCNCGKHGCSTCNGIKRTVASCSPVGGGVYAIVPIESQTACG